MRLKLTGPLLACAAAGLLAAACGSHSGPASGGGSRPTTLKAAVAAARPMAYSLYTHCGIDEAKIGDSFYEAVTPLSDGSGNPPPGWGNPYQAGTMTLVSSGRAVFADKSGHRVVFAVRPGAKTFKHLCS